MGEKDITEKILEDHNDVFADIINGLIFAGEQRILPESLENTAVHSQYKADDEKVHELERDVAKYWKDQDVQLAICGIENQSSVEKYMPFRIIGYDGTAYRSQLQDKRKEILPVMTIVLYFGTEHRWYGKRNIKGLMTNLAHFLPIDEGTEVWSEFVVKHVSVKESRDNMQMKIIKSGYDIISTAKELEQIYLNMSAEEKND